MIWSYFIVFALLSVALWTTGAWAAWRNRRRLAFAATGLGLAVFFAYILIMWITLERPPLRTMGETRLWYSFFLPLAGIIVYSRWQYKWILGFSTLLAAVFVCINLFRPEIHSKTLMPALQSPWFAPHVIVYMMAYALLGAAVVMSVYLLFCKKEAGTDREMEITDNLVYVGLSFMTLGMLMGAIWAKEAWGHYWAWDPKERHGPPSPGCHILSIFIIGCTGPAPSALLCGSSSSLSACCRCAGGESITCRRHRG